MTDSVAYLSILQSGEMVDRGWDRFKSFIPEHQLEKLSRAQLGVIEHAFRAGWLASVQRHVEWEDRNGL